MVRSAKMGNRPSQVVLVVEDDADSRDIYVESLTYFGYRVMHASDAHEALQKLRQRLPDIIAADIGLPGMDGCDLCVLIKRDPRTKKIPVIAVTAWAMKSEMERARRAGFDSLLTKPCLPKDLRAEIQRLLKSTPERVRSKRLKSDL